MKDEPVCECGTLATRRIYPYLEDDPGVYAVCDDDAHIPLDIRDVDEIEAIR